MHNIVKFEIGTCQRIKKKFNDAKENILGVI